MPQTRLERQLEMDGTEAAEAYRKAGLAPGFWREIGAANFTKCFEISFVESDKKIVEYARADCSHQVIDSYESETRTEKHQRHLRVLELNEAMSKAQQLGEKLLQYLPNTIVVAHRQPKVRLPL